MELCRRNRVAGGSVAVETDRSCVVRQTRRRQPHTSTQTSRLTELTMLRSYSLRLTRRLDVRPCLELRRECRQVLPIRCPLKSRSATDAAPDDVTHAPLPRRSEPPAAALDQSRRWTQRFLVPSPQFRLPSSVLAECSVTLQFALPPFSSNAGSFRHRKGNDTRDDLIAPPHVPSPVVSPFLPQTQTRPNRETHTPTSRSGRTLSSGSSD